MALQTSPEQPAPVRLVSQQIGAWVHRLGAIWVEGQVTQINRRPGSRTTFLTLRDPSAQVSLQVTCASEVADGASPPLLEGARVVVHGRPQWYFARGTLSLAVDDIRPVGLGALLARIEELRRLLTAEGLFAPERKRPLPFVPAVVGLVCGRGSAAEHDVLANARVRAAGIGFRIENVPVQGPDAVPEITAALRRLENDPLVDVIIVARGGGSTEDLLAFSDEALVRAVAALRTPVVSAIGHETDSPLLDLVADVRASTPTDAAKRVVPDVADELRGIEAARGRVRARVRAMLDTEKARLDAWRSHPALTRPQRVLVDPRRTDTDHARGAARRALGTLLERDAARLDHTRLQVRALSPAATLERGYAVVQRADGTVVRRPSDVAAGTRLRIVLATGTISAEVVDDPTSPA
jgi:exodeoxyribonuclease VII large subunit